MGAAHAFRVFGEVVRVPDDRRLDGRAAGADGGVADRVRGVVEPVVAGLGLGLFDVEHTGGVVRVTVERPGGVDLDTLAETTRLVSRALDQADPLPGPYTLEVSSPGLERRLRTPAQFAGAVGAQVSIRTKAEVEGERRVHGTLAAADDDGVVVRDAGSGGERRLRYEQIERARTVFEWGPAPKPGSGGKARRKQTKKRTASR